MIAVDFVDDERLTITLTVFDSEGESHEVEATIDTGFVGSLVLPLQFAQQLELLRESMQMISLADGTLTRLPLYMATLEWDNEERTVEALAAVRDTALVGIELLRGTTATFEFFAGGSSSIEVS